MTAFGLAFTLAFKGMRAACPTLVAAAVAAALSACAGPAPQDGPRRPNVLLIVADDLGYSDLSAFGSEIATPHLDALARDGVMLTNFHAGASCTPSRAMLLSGRPNHAVGFGANAGVADRVPELRGLPAYAGAFREGVALLPEWFQAAGYRTFMAGKWHLGETASSFPTARGFERAFFLEYSGASHFADATGNFSHEARAAYWENDRRVAALPEDFFSTTFYTDRVIADIDAVRAEGGAPFFGYLAYTAPHWPLQAPQAWRDRYAGRYDAGWDAVRAARVARLRALGLLPPGAAAAEPPEAVGSWAALTPAGRAREARRMEIYAAMVAHLDHEIGRLITYLKAAGLYEDTIIVFLSDNGPEGNDVLAIRDNESWVRRTFDQSQEAMGGPGSYVSQGRGWAHVSAAPLRLYKSFVTEGGVRTPAIISYPRRLHGATRRNAFVAITDLAPTLLEFADIAPGADAVLDGVSIVRLLVDEEAAPEAPRVFALESYGARAAFRDPWKLAWVWPPDGSGDWALFNVAEDPGERRNRRDARPETAEELIAAWEAFAVANGVQALDRDIGYGRYPDQRGGTREGAP